jgi:hypothetical protein
VWGGVLEWCVLVRHHCFIKEDIFIEGSECTNRYGTVMVVLLSKHLPKLLRLVFKYVWQILLHTCSTHFTCPFKMLVSSSSTCVFFPMCPFARLVLPFSFPTCCIEPGRHVFGPPVRVLMVFQLGGLYYSRGHRFRYQELLDHLCTCLIVVLIFYCDCVESICELVCGGVRLPFSRTAHIFRGLISSYPLISNFLFRRWWLLVWVQLAR